MCAVAPAARPFCGGVPRRSAPVRSDAAAGARLSGTMKTRTVAPSVCLAAAAVFSVPRRKRTKRARNNVKAGAEVLTAAGEMPHKRMASELKALRELVKKAEVISRGSACKSGAAPAGKSKRILAAEPRPEPRMKACDSTPSVKRRKISPLPEQNQKLIKVPWMSPDEREKLAGHLASLAAELPGHIVEFLQQNFGGDADPQGEIEIDIHSVEDSVLFELKTRLDKFAEEHLSADVVSKEEHDTVMMVLDSKTRMDNLAGAEAIVVPEQEEEEIDICGVSHSDSDSSSSSDSDGSSSGSDSDSKSDTDEDVDGPTPPAVHPDENGTSAQPPPDAAPEAVQSTKPERVSDDGVGSTAPPALLPTANIVSSAQPPSRPASEVAQRAEPKKVQDAQRAARRAVCFPGLTFRANFRRELLEMESAVLPDESIHARDLRRLGIVEYGCPSVMRQLGLFLKVDA